MAPNTTYCCQFCGKRGMKAAGSPRNACVSCIETRCPTPWVPNSHDPCPVCGGQLGLMIPYPPPLQCICPWCRRPVYVVYVSGRETKLCFYSSAPQYNHPDHERKAAGCSTWLNVPFNGASEFIAVRI